MSGRFTEELLARLRSLETRLIRVESRMVQLMTHYGVKPKGAISDDERKQRKIKKE